MTEDNQHPQENDLGNGETGTTAAPTEVGEQEPDAIGSEDGRDAVDTEAPASPSYDEPAAAPAPPAPTAPPSPTAAGEPGQRRITRHTTTSTTRTETTDETVVETIAIAPPVYAAPSGEHPRPVG
ncbi:hypothetical protein ACI79P_14315 [Blastococcus sp. SYSU DS0510]